MPQEPFKYIKDILLNMVFGIRHAFSTLLASVFEFAKRPQVLLPALIVALVNFGMVILFSESYILLFSDIGTGNIPDISILEMPYFFLSTYFVEIATITIVLFVSIACSLYLVYTYAKMLSGKRIGIVGSMSYAAGRLGEILLFSLFLMIAWAIFLTALFIAISATFYTGELGVVFIIAVFLVGLGAIYIFARLSYAPLFMFFENMKVRKALSEAWHWSDKMPFKIIFFLLLLSVATQIISFVFGTASDLTESQAVISAIIALLGLLISNAYSAIAFVKYFTILRKI